MPRLSGYIYFIGTDLGLIKIGYSDYYPCKRFRNIQADSPVPLKRLGYIRGQREDEQRLHLRFANLRDHGEWFRATRDLTDFIEAESLTWWPESRPTPTRFQRDMERREWLATLDRFEQTGEV